MTPPAGLAAAVASASYRCVECHSDVIRLDYAPALGWLPVAVHWPVDGGEWCPVLAGGPAAERASLDVLEALAAVVAVASYGEPVWHRRERVTAP